ncbi:MAG TPA: hypothetical protein VKE40_25860 [Gemmataceae bacterium]|nr:hypothetical protein [Gemmataceae bacterium]
MRLLALIAALTAAALLAGCGGRPTYKVTGTVSWKGQPIADGQINFLPEDGNVHPATAKILNGRYEAHVPAGRMKVEIYADQDMGYDPAMHQNVKKGLIPPEYNARSTLSLDVQRHHDNVGDFALPTGAVSPPAPGKSGAK